MSDHDDTCYWLGQPINAMTREKLQDALIECKLALMLKENEIVLLRRHLEVKDEIIFGMRNGVMQLQC